MDVFVGTSGWSYGWNKGRNLDWYLNNSFLNAVELNASYYRFPFRNQIAGWAKKGKDLRWCVKVHRFVTHQYKFNDTARGTWQRFLDLFSPLDPMTDYYLFQAPPSMINSDRLISFFTDLPRLEKCILEIRNPSLLLNDTVCRKLQKCLPLVSVDSPDARNRIFSNSLVYLRMHGRDDWYRHDYTQEELEETAALVRKSGAGKVYIFFNNDHSMLENAQRMRELFVPEGDVRHGRTV
jgi:uncharacterized protein YecE (DUF72 family)